MKTANSFAFSGFVGNSEIRKFETGTAIARFSFAISALDKKDDKTVRNTAWLSLESWRKADSISSFDRIVKGAKLTVEGYLKVDHVIGKDGQEHNRIVYVANKFYETPVETKEEASE